VQLPRATRLVICCKGTADEAMTVMREMMSKLKLTVNETKTRLCRLPDESFDFLGYTLGRNYDTRTGDTEQIVRASSERFERATVVALDPIVLLAAPN
jgi:RNA-directed DNA polymerase